MASIPKILISDYMVVESSTPGELAEAVRKKMADGWQPLGGVSVALSESDDFRYVVYAQAVIRLHIES